MITEAPDFVIAVRGVQRRLQHKLITTDEVDPALKAIARDARFPEKLRKRIYRDLVRFRGPESPRMSFNVRFLRKELNQSEESRRIKAWVEVLDHMIATKEIRAYTLAPAAKRDRILASIRDRNKQKSGGGRPLTRQKVEGRKLKDARRNLSLPQKQLAELCGISEDTVQRAENQNVVAPDILRKMCKQLGVTVESVSPHLTSRT